MRPPLVPLAAIGAITLLEVVALLKGIDGALLTTAIAVIAGLGGYAVAVKRRN